MKKEPQIFTRADVQGVPVDDHMLDAIEQQELVESLIRECIVVGGHASGGHVLGKSRDRNYRPHLRVVRELTPEDIEVVYLHDLDTDYMEGMNSNGIGIVNAALLVTSDEKASKSYWQRTGKKNNSSKDGPRIYKALSYPKLSQVIKSLIGFETGLKGHTLVGNPKSLYSIEMTSKHNPIVNKLNPNVGFDVRTNHGKDHDGAGYNPSSHPQDYLSSKVRKATAEMELADLDNHEEIMPALTKQTFKNDSNYNMRRTTDNMRTSSQTMMHLDKLEFICYFLPDECVFKGVEDRTPRGYEPKIKLRVVNYETSDDDFTA